MEAVGASIIQEEEVLRTLYAPLKADLVGTGGALSKLQFAIQRHVDVKKWSIAGEALVDLRKIGGHGVLQKEAEEILLPAWSNGSANDVADAMDRFRSKWAASLLTAMPASIASSDRKA